VGLVNSNVTEPADVADCSVDVLEPGTGHTCTASITAFQEDFEAGTVLFQVNAQAINRADTTSEVSSQAVQSVQLTQTADMDVHITWPTSQAGMVTHAGGCSVLLMLLAPVGPQPVCRVSSSAVAKLGATCVAGVEPSEQYAEHALHANENMQPCMDTSDSIIQCSGSSQSAVQPGLSIGCAAAAGALVHKAMCDICNMFCDLTSTCSAVSALLYADCC
jgi:hypothetical protein